MRENAGGNDIVSFSVFRGGGMRCIEYCCSSWFVVILCAKVVGATSSEGFLLFLFIVVIKQRLRYQTLQEKQHDDRYGDVTFGTLHPVSFALATPIKDSSINYHTRHKCLTQLDVYLSVKYGRNNVIIL